MQSKATTVKDYLAELPPDRRAAIQTVREVILKNLDKEYEEGMQYGVIGYYVPHHVFPAGYHCDPRQPLPFAGLASQKNYMSVYLMGCYGESDEEKWFRSAWAKTGKKLDMGKCCLRFKRVEDLALDLIGEVVRRMPAEKYIEQYETARQGMASRSGAPKRTALKKASPKKPAVKKAAPKKSTPVARRTTKKKTVRPSR